MVQVLNLPSYKIFIVKKDLSEYLNYIRRVGFKVFHKDTFNYSIKILHKLLRFPVLIGTCF